MSKKAVAKPVASAAPGKVSEETLEIGDAHAPFGQFKI